VLNGKSSPVPEVWRPRIDEFLKKLGYRIVLRRLTHTAETQADGILILHAIWDNAGVAPMYHPRPVAYRLRSDEDRVVAQWISEAQPMKWLPGSQHVVKETKTIPKEVPAGHYHLDVAILNEDGRSAAVSLAIEGKREDHWYPVSIVIIRDEDAEMGSLPPRGNPR
jgi:hypothetical protein